MRFLKEEAYKVPKIMYAPAERNFLSALDRPGTLKGLPRALDTFWTEMDRALHDLNGSFDLPIGNFKLEFEKTHKIAKLDLDSGRKIKLSESSSGYQSFIPLYLVSHNLAHLVQRKSDSSMSELSADRRKKFRAELEKILLIDDSSDYKTRELALLYSKYSPKPDAFLNVVEEIEQNLYPDSQKHILFKLIEFANFSPGNGLMVTTHSLYVISYLSIAIKAFMLVRKAERRESNQAILDEIPQIVPIPSMVDPEQLIVYQLFENGTISDLQTYNGLPEDDNILNQLLADINDRFDSLLDVEEKL